MSHVVSRPRPVGTAAAFSVPIFVLHEVSSSLLAGGFRLGGATKRQAVRSGTRRLGGPRRSSCVGIERGAKVLRFARGTTPRVPLSENPHHRQGVTRGPAQLLSLGAGPTPRGPVRPFFTSTVVPGRLRARCWVK